jgi:hypothetical protein
MFKTSRDREAPIHKQVEWAWEKVAKALDHRFISGFSSVDEAMEILEAVGILNGTIRGVVESGEKMIQEESDGS